MTWRCNGIAECANGEDEKLCGKSVSVSVSVFIYSHIKILGSLLCISCTGRCCV